MIIVAIVAFNDDCTPEVVGPFETEVDAVLWGDAVLTMDRVESVTVTKVFAPFPIPTDQFLKGLET